MSTAFTIHIRPRPLPAILPQLQLVGVRAPPQLLESLMLTYRWMLDDSVMVRSASLGDTSQLLRRQGAESRSALGAIPQPCSYNTPPTFESLMYRWPLDVG
mmetsp:Transcript_11115/g.24492  ORF Transcript_11115/g.24492 Transcript_11115/m.24492 type:complete len:101 (-) Transcript_11115:154-456(-)